MNANNPDYICSGGAKFDFLKAALAFLILCLHTGFFLPVFSPILRIAVPCFFIMTSYFFFLKVSRVGTEKERCACLKAFVKRNLSLYAFWFVVLLPVIVLRKGYFVEMTAWESVGRLALDFLFDSTFQASWFIMASVLSVILVFYASKICNVRIILAISLLLYLVCCLCSNYYAILDEVPMLKEAVLSVTRIFGEVHNGIPAAFLWIVVGKMLADNPIFGKLKLLRGGLAASFAMLYFEYFIVNKYSLAEADDCYVSLIPLCTSLFVLIGQHRDISLKHPFILRKCSTIVYCSHGSVAAVVRFLLGARGCAWEGTVVFLITSCICAAICFLILKLKERKNFKWLSVAC